MTRMQTAIGTREFRPQPGRRLPITEPTAGVPWTRLLSAVLRSTLRQLGGTLVLLATPRPAPADSLSSYDYMALPGWGGKRP